ncbi:MAG: hypothetical protein ACREBZ_00510 [Thermoplasmata archaeon]
MAPDAPPLEIPEVRLKDLRPSDLPIQLVARIVSVERREYTRPADGRRRPFLSGLLSDGSASVRFTWWEPPNETIERGTIVRAVHVQVREFQGRPEVAFNFRTRVTPAGPAELPAIDSEDVPFRTVSTLQSRQEGFRIEVRVVRVGAKNVTVGTEQRVVHDGIFADRTGVLAFSSWSDFGLRADEAIRVAGAYVGAFRGRPQLVLDEGSIVTRIEGPDLPRAADVLRKAPTSISELEAAGGSESGAFEGLVVGTLPTSGLVYRCPSCRRPIAGGLCPTHGTVSGVADLRSRLIVDDGTGTVTVNADRAATEALWGVSLDAALERLRRSPDPSLLEADLAEQIVGRRVRVRGRVYADDFGLNVYPDSIESLPFEVDTKGLAERLRGSDRGAA